MVQVGMRIDYHRIRLHMLYILHVDFDTFISTVYVRGLCLQRQLNMIAISESIIVMLYNSDRNIFFLTIDLRVYIFKLRSRKQ